MDQPHAPAGWQPEAAPYQHRGTPAVSRMVEYAPSTGGLALWVRHQDAPDAAQPPAPGAADQALLQTDGHVIVYAPAFAALPLPQQAGWVAHEVLHIALRHAQRYLALQDLLGDVDLRLFNVCADAIVNSALSHLAWLQLPPAAVELPRLLKVALNLEQSADQALAQWDVESLYRALDDRLAPSGGRSARQSQSGAAQAGASTRPQDSAARALSLARPGQADLTPGARTRAAPEDEAEQTREWRERLLRGHAGDGAHSILRALMADLPHTRTPWEQVLRTQLARHLAQAPELTWSRPSRSYLANQGRMGRHRMPFEPGVSPQRAVPQLVLVVDVSGSIDAPLLRRFSSEIASLARRLSCGLTLVLGDDRVREVRRFAPGRVALDELVFRGGGGTDFTPLLQEAERYQPDITVVLTDLEGPAQHRPRCPVLWAVPAACEAAAVPFGRKLVLS